MEGENFTREYKFPIKIYHIWQIEFANGLEVRKMVVSGVVVLLMLFIFFVLGASSNEGAVRFILENWLIILVGVPGIITFVVFSMKYDHKPVIPFLKDRIAFYQNRNKAYEHFEEVPLKQFETELQFEIFERSKQKDGD